MLTSPTRATIGAPIAMASTAAIKRLFIFIDEYFLGLLGLDRCLCLQRKLFAGLFCNHVRGVPLRPVRVALSTGALFVLAVRRLRTPKGIGQVGHRCEPCFGAINPAGKSRCDLL